MDGINYQTLSPKDLAKSVMALGGWSEYLVNNSNPVLCILFFSNHLVTCFFCIKKVPEEKDAIILIYAVLTPFPSIQCSGKESQPSVDIALLFVGKEVGTFFKNKIMFDNLDLSKNCTSLLQRFGVLVCFSTYF